MKKIALLTILIVLVAIGCNSLKKALPKSEARIQDNGKNLVWISTPYISDFPKSLILIQKWINEHPTKKIVAMSAGSVASWSQTGWLLIYENR